MILGEQKKFTLGENLRQLRLKRGWTQRETADKLGFQPSTYSRYESNEVIPNVETLMDIANLYGVGLDELMGFVPKTENKITKLDSALYRLKEMSVDMEVDRDAVNIDVYGRKYVVNISDLAEVVERTDLQFDKMMDDLKILYNASLGLVLNGGDFFYEPFFVKRSELSDKLKKALEECKGKITPDDVVDWFKDYFVLMNHKERKELWDVTVESLLYHKKISKKDYEKDERWRCPFVE